MKSALRPLWLVTLLFLISSLSMADDHMPSLELSSAPEDIRAFPVRHLLDASNQLNGPHVQHNQSLATLTTSDLILPFINGDHWLLFELKNDSPRPMQRTLWTTTHELDAFRLFILQGEQLIPAPTPDQRSSASFDGAHYAIALPPNTTQTYYLHIRYGSGLKKLDVRITPKDHYDQFTARTESMGAILIMLMSVLIVVALGLLLRQRTRVTAMLLAMLIVQLLWMFAPLGIQWFGLASWLGTQFLLTGIPLSMGLMMHVSRLYTQTNAFPRTHRSLTLITIGFLLLTLVSQLNFLLFGYIQVISAPLLILALFGFSVLVLLKAPHAKMILTALTMYTAGYCLNLLANMGYIELSFITQYSHPLAATLCSATITFTMLITDWSRTTPNTTASPGVYRAHSAPAYPTYSSTPVDLSTFSNQPADESDAPLAQPHTVFAQTLERLWLSHAASRSPLSLLAVNIDHFSLYNDTFGKKKGDEVINRVIDTLCSVTRDEYDVVGYLEDSNLAVVLPSTSIAVAKALADTAVNQCWNHGIEHVNVAGRITLSVGLATIVPTNSDSYGTLIQQANRALKQQKHQGGNGTMLYQPNNK